MNHLSDLPFEIIINITRYLSAKGILRLACCSKRLSEIRFAIKFKEQVYSEQIRKLSYLILLLT